MHERVAQRLDDIVELAYCLLYVAEGAERRQYPAFLFERRDLQQRRLEIGAAQLV